MAPGRRHALPEGRLGIAELPPLAARLDVPVLAGTDVTGRSRREMALLAQMELAGGGQRRHRHLPSRPPLGPRPAGPSGRRGACRNSAALKTGGTPLLASDRATHAVDQVAQSDAVLRKECRDLVLIDRIGQHPLGLLGYLRESCLAQRISQMLPGVLHRVTNLFFALAASGWACH
jgi:hypothetical protein